jgi:hypothetical protein
LLERAPEPSFQTAVDHFHRAVGIKCLIGGDGFKAFLKGRFVAKLFVPPSHVATQIDRLDGLWHRPIANRSGARDGGAGTQRQHLGGRHPNKLNFAHEHSFRHRRFYARLWSVVAGAVNIIVDYREGSERGVE